MNTRVLLPCIFFIFSFFCLKAQDTLWVEITDSSNMDMTPSEYLESVFEGIDVTKI